MKFPVPFPRRADETVLPAALAALLLAVLVVQLALPPRIDLPEIGFNRPFRLAPIGVAPVVADPAITAQTLFSPGRSPDGAPGPGDTTAPLGGARAVGAISVRGRARVFMQDGSGRTTGIGIGDSIAGWRLVQIRGGELLFVRGPDSITLPISTSAAPAPSAPTPAPDEQEEETP